MNFTEPFYARPVVLVTPKQSDNNNNANLSGSRCNAVTAWVEVRNTYCELRVLEISAYMYYIILRNNDYKSSDRILSMAYNSSKYGNIIQYLDHLLFSCKLCFGVVLQPFQRDSS